ncbi:hypothetical protein LJC74_08245 [Eubacteriales bacterium OttesenSCG-928-A19]|nr:hypothetical protein [Eubacteriales bacterium OttesenSCG-928-A19]
MQQEAHWQVENNLHWMFVFKEDDWETKKAAAASNLAVLRYLTASLLRNETSFKLSASQKRFSALSTLIIFSLFSSWFCHFMNMP